MIFRNNDIPKGYNNLAEISDNYLVWVRESTLESGRNYTAVVQYLSPSFVWFVIDDYKIKTGTRYRLDANYLNNGVYSYLDNYDVSFSLDTSEVDISLFSDNDFDRADMPLIFICQFLCVVIFVWMLNQLSKLVKKDGVFH